MRITFQDGDSFEGDDYKEIIEKLKRVDSTQPATIEEYMSRAEIRYLQIDVKINTSAPKKFIESMEEEGVIKLEGE